MTPKEQEQFELNCIDIFGRTSAMVKYDEADKDERIERLERMNEFYMPIHGAAYAKLEAIVKVLGDRDMDLEKLINLETTKIIKNPETKKLLKYEG